MREAGWLARCIGRWTSLSASRRCLRGCLWLRLLRRFVGRPLGLVSLGSVIESTKTYTESDDVGSVWLDGNKVVGKDGHVMAINTEFLNSSDAGIDQAKSVLLSTDKVEFRHTCIVDA